MSVPNEVVEDILSRLPVESLLRFRSVTPPWRDLIDSPHFVKLHLNRSIETETNLSLILEDRNKNPTLFAAKFAPSALSVEAKELDHHPLREDRYELNQVWGSCNGLLCLGDVSHTNIVIWNPSTRRYVTLPYADLDCKRLNLEAHISNYRRSCGFGFGYDSVGDDYKVVRLMGIVRIGSTARVNEIMIYSLRAHSWHHLNISYNNLPCMNSEPGQSVTNVTHWIMILNTDKPGVIVEFNFHTETCRIVPGPELEHPIQDLSVEPYRDSICALYIYGVGVIDSWVNVDLWVMEEYGVMESWTKLFSFVPKLTRPVYVPKKRRGIFMQHDGKFLWSDTVDENLWFEYDSEYADFNPFTKNIEVRGLKNFKKVGVYVASLVPLGRFSKMADERKSKEKRKDGMSGFLSKGFKLVL